MPYPLFFSGSSHLPLAKEIVTCLNGSLSDREILHFPDGEISLEIKDSVERRDVFLLQSLGKDPHFHIFEMLMLIDALKRASAASITLVLPYFVYARQDRINKPGQPITAKLLANLMTRAGINQLITIDLHSEQIEGFFDIPVFHLLSSQVIIPHYRSLCLGSCVVVAPDKGAIKIASHYAKQLDAPLALIDKERIDSYRVKMRLFLGEVKDQTVLLTDDMCSTAGTLVNAAKICEELGAKRIIALATHPLLAGEAMKKIENSPIEMLIVTNTIPLDEAIANHPKIRTVSIAPLVANAIKKIINGPKLQ